MIPHASKNSHCSFCGAYFLEQKFYTKKCTICENITYYNPLPVSVSLIRIMVESDSKIGVLVVQRSIDPKLGEWALPGGYLIVGESWQAGAVREIQEEVGIELDTGDIETYHVVDTVDTNNLLIFNTCTKIINWNDIKFTPNKEISDIDVCFLPTELAFPTHTEYLNKYLKEINL